MFKIKKVRPMFTGIIITAKRYVGDIITDSGLVITNKMDGQLNVYQTVIAVGSLIKDIKPGDIVRVNFNRYAKAKHVPGKIDAGENTQADNMSYTYEIPMIPIDGEEYLLIQNNDIEYVVEDFEVDEGGLLQ